MRFITTYVLELEDNKYYVGMTCNLNLRLLEHFTGEYSAKWTSKYKPIRLQEVHIGNIERVVTLKYMLKYGFKNVRGAGWCRIEMKNPPKALATFI